VPKTEAVSSRGYYFCTDECVRQFLMDHSRKVAKAENDSSS
jgi:YHS domain-containing protein